jgi:hypothetical protein
MATRAKFPRLALYSGKFGEASHIFLKNGKCWRVWRIRQMMIFGGCEFGEYSIKTLAPSQCTCQAWYICAILAKHAKLAKYHDKYFGKCEFGKYSKKSLASLASLASHKKIPKLSLWRVQVFFVKYSNLLNSRASGHSLKKITENAKK